MSADEAEPSDSIPDQPASDDVAQGDPARAVEPHLAQLGQRFMQALEQVRGGNVDAAAEELRAILKLEPRLAEPRIELARVLLETDQAEEAAEQAEEAVRILEGGGLWTEELPQSVVLGVAWNLRAEALRRQADRDEVVFGDPDKWRDLMARSREAFAKAAALDPDNAHAAYWAGGTDAELQDTVIPDDDEDPQG